MEFISAEQDVTAVPPQMEEGVNPWIRMFNRVFSRHAMNIAILLMIPLIFAPSVNRARGFISDPDLWWHLADARLLFTTHHFIHVDPYSFSAVGDRWIDWEWLAEMPFWLSYKAFGLLGIYFVTWLALGANILFVYWRGYLRSRHSGAAFFAAGLAFFLMTANAGPRTIAFAYLAMSAELAILEVAERGRKRLLWLLPPLFCLWINLHGTWFFGICLLVLYIACGLLKVRAGSLEQDSLAKSDRKRLIAVLGVSVLALLLNPYGWRLMWSPIDMIFNQTVSVSTISEWQPLDIGSPRGLMLLVSIAIIVLANCIRSRKWTLFDLATVFFAYYASFAHTRFTYTAAVLITPIIACDMERAFYSESDKKTIPFMNALIVVAAIGVMVFTFPSKRELRVDLSERFPMQSIASIQPGWRTLNVDSVGGMMDFESKPTFIDSRFDSFEHNGVLQDFLAINSLHDPIRLIGKYKIDHVFLNQYAPLTRLLEGTPGWHVLSKEGSGSAGYELLGYDEARLGGSSGCNSSGKGN